MISTTVRDKILILYLFYFKFEFQTASTRPTNLVAKILSPLASGTYKCEITVETPSFRTETSEMNLTVVGELAGKTDLLPISM